MKLSPTALQDVFVIEPNRFEDPRGFFSESWNLRTMQNVGLDYNFVQDNHSFSKQTGTVRGLHFQSPPDEQAKLVRCGRGALFDVAVDIRKGSPSYGKWFGVELSFENGKQLLIPAGFLHGFVTLLPDTEIVYKCSDYYSPACDGAVRFDDPTIGIDWQLGEQDPILSEKDANAGSLLDLDNPFTYDGNS